MTCGAKLRKDERQRNTRDCNSVKIKSKGRTHTGESRGAKEEAAEGTHAGRKRGTDGLAGQVSMMAVLESGCRPRAEPR